MYLISDLEMREILLPMYSDMVAVLWRRKGGGVRGGSEGE